MEFAIPDLASRTRLTIHVIGATEREIVLLRLNEELLHLLPNLKSVIVGYIGPDVPTLSIPPGQLVSTQCCPVCTSEGRQRQIFLRRELYHECSATDLFSHSPPDLIVACNSGHADDEIDSWRPTLSRVLDMDTPAVFTTYNEREARDEEAVLSSIGARFLQTREENRWRGMVPKLENFGARYEVFYYNYFNYVVKGRRY
ncbi:MAG: hypothetical protein LQ346_008751 [Caloplaca aetnensis]|nr:MAG: hypothetical protein LQ346_008751 [Caloplaca aetnensis]